MVTPTQARQQLGAARAQLEMQKQLVAGARLQAQSASLPTLGQTQLRGRGVMGLIKRRIQESQLAKQKQKAFQQIGEAETQLGQREQQLQDFEGAIEQVEAQQRAIREAEKQSQQIFKYQTGAVGALEPGTAKKVAEYQAGRMQDVDTLVQNKLGVSYQDLVAGSQPSQEVLSLLSQKDIEQLSDVAGVEIAGVGGALQETMEYKNVPPGYVNLGLSKAGVELTTNVSSPLQLDIGPDRGAVDVPQDPRMLDKLRAIVGADGFDIDKFKSDATARVNEGANMSRIPYGPQQLPEVNVSLTPFEYKPQFTGATEWQNILSGAQMSAQSQPGALWKPIKIDEQGRTLDIVGPYFGDEALAYVYQPQDIKLWEDVYTREQKYGAEKPGPFFEEISKEKPGFIQKNILDPASKFIGGVVRNAPGLPYPYNLVDVSGLSIKGKRAYESVVDVGVSQVPGNLTQPSFTVPQRTTIGGFQPEYFGGDVPIQEPISFLAKTAPYAFLGPEALIGTGASFALSPIATPQERTEGLILAGFGAGTLGARAFKPQIVNRKLGYDPLLGEARAGQISYVDPLTGRRLSRFVQYRYRPETLGDVTTPIRKFFGRKPLVSGAPLNKPQIDVLSPAFGPRGEFLKTPGFEGFYSYGRSPYVGQFSRVSKVPYGLTSADDIFNLALLGKKTPTSQFKFIGGPGRQITFADLKTLPKPLRRIYEPLVGKDIQSLPETSQLGKSRIATYDWAGNLGKKTQQFFVGSRTDPFGVGIIERGGAKAPIRILRSSETFKDITFPGYRAAGKIPKTSGIVIEIPQRLPKSPKPEPDVFFPKASETNGNLPTDTGKGLRQFFDIQDVRDFTFISDTKPIQVPPAPKSPKISTRTSLNKLSASPDNSLLVGIPRMVGGAGLTDSQIKAAQGRGSDFLSVGTTRNPIDIKVDTKEVSLLGNRPKTKARIKPLAGIGLKPQTKANIKSALKPLTGLRTPTRIKDLLKTNAKVTELLKTSQKQSLREAIKPSQRTPTRITTRPAPRPPRRTTFVPPNPPKDPLAPKTTRRPAGWRGYVAEVRRFGTFMPVGRTSTFEKAFGIGKRRVKETLGASLRIRKAGTGEIVPLAPGGFFRSAKREPGVLVQKRGKRLSDPLEVKEIKRSRRRKRKIPFGL